MAWILLRPSNYKQVAPLVRTGGSRHTGLAAPPHRNIHDTRVIVRICCKLICIFVLYAIIPKKNGKVISSISKNSFGIYLFHSPLIYITFSFFANESVLFVVLLNFVIFGGVSLFITEFIRRRGLGLVIGE